jgi:hypothetical protein
MTIIKTFLKTWAEESKIKITSLERPTEESKWSILIKTDKKVCNIIPETDNQLQIHTPKLPTAGLSPPSATSDTSTSAKKTSVKKRATSEILGIHILCRITA